jgi:hypothetical protein
MINIDTVYQKVLALANKEQRGYITPQEFNLFANIAQDEILDQYFYDLTTKDAIPTDNTEYADMMDGIDEKLGELKTTVELNLLTDDNDDIVDRSMYVKPTDIYKIGLMEQVNARGFGSVLERIDKAEWNAIRNSPLLMPRLNNAVYLDYDNVFRVAPTMGPAQRIELSYIPTLPRINWTYIVINEAPMFNGGSATLQNCMLHVSEENVLIYKILRLSGVAIQKKDIAQSGLAMESTSQSKRLNK